MEPDTLTFQTLEQRVLLSQAAAFESIDLARYEPSVAELIRGVTTSDSALVAERHGEVRPVDPNDVNPNDIESTGLIRLLEFWQDPQWGDQYTGAGWSTVIIDTGIDLDHPLFGPDSDGDGVADRIVYHYDFADNDDDASDFDGHGTNVSSIVAGQAGSTLGGGAFLGTGVAPGADIIHLKVFPDAGGGAPFPVIESALQWVIANADTFNIASVNMSLGTTSNFDFAATDEPLSDELAALAALGVITVSSAGNSYAQFQAIGTGYPSADINSISVGAVYDAFIGDGIRYGSGAEAFSTSVDQITPFSQRHPELTEVFAPGAEITGAGLAGSLSSLHGTSQASPHVAGAAVIMQQIFFEATGRRLTIDEFRTLLSEGSTSIFDGDNEFDNVLNTFLSYNRLDIVQLADRLQIPPRPMPSATLPGAAIEDGALVFTGADISAQVEWDFILGEEMFVYQSVASGTLTINGAPAVQGDLINDATALRWTPDAFLFGETAPALTLLGFDGNLLSEDTIELSVYFDTPPTLAPIESLGDAIEKTDFEIDIANLLARLDAQDFEGTDLEIRVVGVGSGSLARSNGAGLSDLDSIDLRTIDGLVWRPGAEDVNDTLILRVAAFDGFNLSETVELTAYVQASPRLSFLLPIDSAGAPEAQVIRYEDILALTDLSDPNGDVFSIVINSVFNGSLSQDGALITTPLAIGPGQQVVWTPDGTSEGAYAAFTIIASDGTLSSDPFTLRVRFAESFQPVEPPANDEPAPTDPVGGEPPATPGDGSEGDGEQPPASATPPPAAASIDDAGALYVFARDTEGDLFVFENPGAEWTADDLSAALGLDGAIGDPITWYDELTERSFAAATVDERLLLFRQTTDGSWSAVDLTTQLPGAALIERGLTSFTDTQGRTSLAGLTRSGDLVLYRQTGAMDAFGNAAWEFRNLSAQDLRLNGQQTPQFVGDLIAYVTPWNGLHIAGLDSDGDIRAVWWAPRLQFWQASNLTAITGSEPLSGGLTAFLTPWGGVNLAGADAEGDLAVTWWVPGFGGEWRLTNLTEAADGPRLVAATTASYVTSWGGLNVAGVDESGDLVVYWWSPQSNRWRADALTDGTESESPVGAIRGVSRDDSTMHLFARSAEGDVLRFFWSPTAGWASENVTDAAAEGVVDPA
ncbi:MAG: S8 family serine peptidase [Planctomycetota bacterium]